MHFTAFSLLFIFGALPLIHALFMDMYGKVFQIELLDDCTIYAYDRVLDPNGPKGWCKRAKSSMNHMITIYRDGNESIAYVEMFCYYVDDENILNLIRISSNGQKGTSKLFSQDYFEANVGSYSDVIKNQNVNHTRTSTGQFRISDFYALGLVGKPVRLTLEYISFVGNKSFGRLVKYDRQSDVVFVEPSTEIFEPNVFYDYHTIVRPDPKTPGKFHCGKYQMNRIKPAIKTTCIEYKEVKNFSESFTVPFATEMTNESRSYAGMIMKNGEFFSSLAEKYERPTIEKYYSEVPFFVVSSSMYSYSPLFLYYKYKGELRDFTVRFVYDNKPQTIFEPLQYMKDCGFDELLGTVAAAPKILRHDEKSISFEVYFLVNNVNFQYCVFVVDFDIATKFANVTHGTPSEINAYVHVQNRSTTAVNCDFGNRTVRWLLAYTENKEGELVSLDNGISSPIFPCPHCGNKTIMYCDVNPATAKKYDSAVYLITGNKILYVGVTRTGYIKKIEYYTEETENENYFLQEISMTLSLDEIYKSLGHGKFGEDTKKQPEKEADKPQATACAPCNLGMSSLLFLVMMTYSLY